MVELDLGARRQIKRALWACAKASRRKQSNGEVKIVCQFASNAIVGRGCVMCCDGYRFARVSVAALESFPYRLTAPEQLRGSFVDRDGKPLGKQVALELNLAEPLGDPDARGLMAVRRSDTGEQRILALWEALWCQYPPMVNLRAKQWHAIIDDGVVVPLACEVNRAQLLTVLKRERDRDRTHPYVRIELNNNGTLSLAHGQQEQGEVLPAMMGRESVVTHHRFDHFIAAVQAAQGMVGLRVGPHRTSTHLSDQTGYEALLSHCAPREAEDGRGMDPPTRDS